jgi:hypothetical protein
LQLAAWGFCGSRCSRQLASEAVAAAPRLTVRTVLSVSWCSGSRCAALQLLAFAAPVLARGGEPERRPGLEGLQTLLGEPASMLVLLALALLWAQAAALSDAQRGVLRWSWVAGVGGLACGSAVAATGYIADPTLLLYLLATSTGVLVAWGRRWPVGWAAAVAALAGAAVVMMLMPASTPDAASRAWWLVGVLLSVLLLLFFALGLLKLGLGRRPGPVRLLLLRVLGSWIAAAALLAGVLEVSRRWV